MYIRRISSWPTFNLKGSWEELDRMRREMENLKDGLTSGLFAGPVAGVFPAMNITENADAYFIRAELPGLSAEDFEITVTSDSLSISGERKILVEKKDAKYHRREREAGKFSRIVNLPGQVNTEKVEAGCSDGILTVTLPKAAISKPKQISVKAGA